MDLNIEQMKELIDLFEGSNLSEINVQQDDFQVTLKKNSARDSKFSSGATSSHGAAETKITEEEGEPEEAESGTGTVTEEETRDQDAITSPIVGTFYRSPSPEEPSYVEVGDLVEEGETVCIVEAMKVMNEVKSQKTGQVTEVCVDDGDSVEYGQELFKLVPPDEGS